MTRRVTLQMRRNDARFRLCKHFKTLVLFSNAPRSSHIDAARLARGGQRPSRAARRSAAAAAARRAALRSMLPTEPNGLLAVSRLLSASAPLSARRGSPKATSGQGEPRGAAPRPFPPAARQAGAYSQPGGSPRDVSAARAPARRRTHAAAGSQRSQVSPAR